MEYLLDASTLYSCKLCGIQAMTLADAESHIFEDEHKKQREEKLVDDTKYLSREEAEEALFLNQNKEIKDIVINDKKFYSCEKCRAMKLPLHVIQKHVSSLVHKKNFRDTDDAAMLEQECKEMKMKGKRTTTYFCTPCGFTSDSIISTKHHLIEATHKKRCMNYCHACKTFSANRGKHQEHRFSIAHKRTMTELDTPFKEKKKEKKEDEDEDETKEKKKRSGDDEDNVPQAPAEPENPLHCKWCKFDGEDEAAMVEHKALESHRRKQYLATGKMDAAPEGEERLISNREFTNLEHMTLLHKVKELQERAARTRNQQLDEELKKARKETVEELFKQGVFERMDETAIKCTSCSIKLSGGSKGKKLDAQLFAHFIDNKHIMRLRMTVKEEEVGTMEEEDLAETVPDDEDDKEDQEPEEQQMVLPDPLVLSVHQFLTDEEAELLLEAMARPVDDGDDETMEQQKARLVARISTLYPALTPLCRMALRGVASPVRGLHACSACATGLMTGKFIMRHIDTPEHRSVLRVLDPRQSNARVTTWNE
jgi:hypothetical protein